MTIARHQYAWLHVAYDRVIASARRTLGDNAVAAAWQEGRGLPLHSAIDEAIALTKAGARSISPAPPRTTAAFFKAYTVEWQESIA